MIKKNIILISLIFFFTSCGFTPIYLKNTNVNFSIEQLNFKGDRELSNFLKINLNQFKNKKSENKIYVDVDSKYEKTILSKDGAGKATNYELKAEVIFLIKSTNKKIKIVEKEVMKSMNDKFEEENYETSIKENFASSISYKFTSELIFN